MTFGIGIGLQGNRFGILGEYLYVSLIRFAYWPGCKIGNKITSGQNFFKENFLEKMGTFMGWKIEFPPSKSTKIFFMCFTPL